MDIVRNYLINANTPKDLRYYLIKYKSFNLWDENQTDGFYWWHNYTNKPYECTMLFRTNFRGRSWSPFLLEINKRVNECSLDNYNSNLQYTKDNLILIISHISEGFKFSCPTYDNYSADCLNQLINNNKLNQDSFLLIEQNDNGIDILDRIDKCIDFLNNSTPSRNQPNCHS